MLEFIKTMMSALKTYVDSKIVKSKANWNQNDPSADDYIKNRTHWEETKEIIIIPSIDAVFEYEDGSDTTWSYICDGDAIIVGQEYTVNFDGAEYKCKGMDLDGIFIGNPAIWFYEEYADKDNGMPFCIYDYGTELWCGVFNPVSGADETHNVEVIVSDILVHKLDEKYLPASVNLKAAGLKVGSNAEIFNDYNNNVASGNHSHAEGSKTTASENYSHAEGFKTTASGGNSHAEGYKTTASNLNSHAEGSNTTASGDSSHAEGYNTLAYGHSSHAEGCSTKASGTFSHTEGSYTTASSGASHAEGSYTTVTSDTSVTSKISTDVTKGLYGHAEGYGTVVTGACGHAEGNGTKASGYSSHAEGYLTKATNTDDVVSTTNAAQKGYYTHAEGYGTVSYGAASHAEGNGTKASGNNSHAEGFKTTASANNAHSEGGNTTASGDYSHAEGFSTTASANNAHSEGSITTASGVSSHAEGSNTIADSDSQHVQGKFNNTEKTYYLEFNDTEESISLAPMSYYEYSSEYSLDTKTGAFSLINSKSANPTDIRIFPAYLCTNGSWYKLINDQDDSTPSTFTGIKFNISSSTYAHIVGNGTSETARSNAHTLDWEGNAWYAGDVYVGGTGQNDTDNVKKLATEEYVDNAVVNAGGGTSGSTVQIITWEVDD